MNNLFLAFSLGIGLSVMTIFADMLIKNASLQKSFSGWQMLFVGALIYGLTALGWFWVMRNMKLSTLGVLYGVSCIVLITIVSVFYYKEAIRPIEVFGIVLAVISIIILARFA